MANTPNTIDYAGEDLATFLAKVNGDGTNEDIYGALKSDAPGSEVPATGISTAAGQLLENGRDDAFQASYPNNRNVALGNGGMTLTTGSAKTANYTLVAGELVRYNASGGTFTVDLPLAPADNARAGIVENNGDATTITVDGDVNTVIGSSGTSGTTATEGSAFVVLIWEYNADDATWFLISDASTGGGGAPAAHAASHENGGGDEISVLGLSGLLADSQTPIPTAAVDTTALHDNVAGEIAAITAKTKPVGADTMVINDSAAADAVKSATLTALVTEALNPTTAVAAGSTGSGSTRGRIFLWSSAVGVGQFTWGSDAANGTWVIADRACIANVSVALEANAGAGSTEVAINVFATLQSAFDGAWLVSPGWLATGTHAITPTSLNWTGPVVAGDVIWVSANTVSYNLSASVTKNRFRVTEFGKYNFG